jgi:hypothetical protein
VGEEIQALSSDEPPVVGPDAQPLPDGSTLHLVDTGECYVFHAGAWVPDLRLARAIRHSAAL